jgi:hypothetical protein
MLEAEGTGGGAGGEGGPKFAEVCVGWRRILGKVWAAVAERVAPASPPTPAAVKLRVGSIIIDTPACRLELKLWRSITQRRM